MNKPKASKRSPTTWKRHTSGLICLAVLITVLVAGFYYGQDIYADFAIVDCHDPEGPRHKIDARQFASDYFKYSYTFEADVAGNKLLAKIEPKLLYQLSQSIQTGQQFRKTLVQEFNSCVVTPPQFHAALTRFQALDGIAGRIDAIANKSSLTSKERLDLDALAAEYVSLSQILASSIIE